MAMLTKVARLLIAIGLLAGFTVGWASQLTGEQVITVCPQGPPACQFSRIQEAINVATDEAVIMIAPGTYVEQGELKISKNIYVLGSGPGMTRIITDRVNVKGPAQVMISGLAIQGLALYGALKVYEAKVTLTNVDLVGDISVNDIETAAEQPKPSQLILIDVHVLGSLGLGPTAEAIVTTSELISSGSAVFVTQNAQLKMSRSLLRSTDYYADGLVASGGAKVWLSDTQIEISFLPIGPGEQEGPVGIVAREGSDVVLQRIKIFSTNHGILIENKARLHIEASQVIAINGWGVSLVIEPCGVRLPPTADPSPQTFEGFVTGRNNEITGARELGDVCPSKLEFLKTPEGGQYP
jgi:hypothetical protein